MISMEGGSEIQGGQHNDNEEKDNVEDQNSQECQAYDDEEKENTEGTYSQECQNNDDEEAEILEEAPFEVLSMEKIMLLEALSVAFEQW